MKNLKNLSNRFLLEKTKSLVADERRLTTEVLWHLSEIGHRRLYSEMGFGSLFEYAVKELGYSEAAAGRRIAAMKLLSEVPEIEPALKNGTVHLSTLSTIQYFVQRKDAPTSRQEMKELVLSLQGKSRRECEKALAAIAPEAAPPAERERVISPSQTEIRFVADDELMTKLQRIRDLGAHTTNGGGYLELFHRIAEIALKKLDPLAFKKAQEEIQSGNVTSAPPAESVRRSLKHNPRFISAKLKRKIWIRDHARCSYLSADGRRCESRYALQIDHQIPLSLGGRTELENLRLLCRAHNLQQAIVHLGEGTMRRFQKFGHSTEL